MLANLDSSPASRYGRGWHAQNGGWKCDDLFFFSIQFGAFQMDGWLA